MPDSNTQTSKPLTDTNGQNAADNFAANIGYIKNYVLAKKLVIVAVALVMAVLALVYAFIKKPYYTAESTFVLENNSNPLGAYAGLAAMAGINVDNGSGVFSGENIIELYQSRNMLEKTLLSKASAGNPETLISRYIRNSSKWRDEDAVKGLNFNIDKKNYTKTQDSVLFEIVKEIRKTYLIVEKLDKKTIISVKVKSKDEGFAKAFNETLVANVNSMYVGIKSKKAMQNVQILQRQADSVRRDLNSNMRGAASASDAVPNANPFQQVLRVPSQRKGVDVQANTAVYAELIKNLEMAKVTLLKETPLIQHIDKPELPLEKEKISKVIYALAGLIAGAFLAAGFFVFKALGKLN